MSTIPNRASRVRTAVRGVIGTSIAVPMLFSAMPAMAQNQQEQMEQLRQQIEQLQDRFSSLQQQQQAAEQRAKSSEQRLQQMQTKQASAAEPEEDDVDGFKVGNTTVKLNGYFKLDAIYDFEDDHGVSLGPSDAIGTLDGKGTDHPGDADTGMSIKQTRLKLSTTTPTPIGDVGGYIEMDLYGRGDFGFDSGPQPRVRRAYLTMPLGPGTLLAGRDWSTFSDFNYGTMLNFYGPQAQLFERQAQLRYTLPVDDNTTVDFSLENPGGGTVLAGDSTDPNFLGIQDQTIADSGSASGGTENTIPDIAVRLQSTAGPLSFQAAAIGRHLSADINDGSLKGDEDSTIGYGLDLGGSLALPTGTTFMLTGVYGEGIGKYFYAPAGGADAYVTNDGELEAIERYGFIGTISQELTSSLTTNVVYGKGFSENPDDYVGSTDDLHDESSTIAVNLLYTPVDPLTFGIEYNRSDYERISGENAHAQNVQFSTIYNF